MARRRAMRCWQWSLFRLDASASSAGPAFALGPDAFTPAPHQQTRSRVAVGARAQPPPKCGGKDGPRRPRRQLASPQPSPSLPSSPSPPAVLPSFASRFPTVQYFPPPGLCNLDRCGVDSCSFLVLRAEIQGYGKVPHMRTLSGFPGMVFTENRSIPK